MVLAQTSSSKNEVSLAKQRLYKQTYRGSEAFAGFGLALKKLRVHYSVSF